MEDLESYLDDTETESEKVKANKFKEENIKKIGEVKIQKMMKVPVKEESRQPRQNNSGPEAIREEKVIKRSVKTAPIPIPKWDGKSKTYPRFKLLWEGKYHTLP